MFKIFTAIILSLLANNVQTSEESVQKTKKVTLFYTSWVSRECDILGDMPNDLVRGIASKFDIKTDFVFRIDSPVKLVVSISCNSKINPIYLIEVHFEKYDDENGYTYVGKVYVRPDSAVGPVYFDKDSLINKLGFVVEEAIADFYLENRK
jgi:hypothetical protein